MSGPCVRSEFPGAACNGWPIFPRSDPKLPDGDFPKLARSDRRTEVGRKKSREMRRASSRGGEVAQRYKMWFEIRASERASERASDRVRRRHTTRQRRSRARAFSSSSSSPSSSSKSSSIRASPHSAKRTKSKAGQGRGDAVILNWIRCIAHLHLEQELK